jgi:hypothetical protein
MKASELVKILQPMLDDGDDYEIKLSFYDKQIEPLYLEQKRMFPPYRWLKINKLVDVGVSDKELLFDCIDEQAV